MHHARVLEPFGSHVQAGLESAWHGPGAGFCEHGSGICKISDPILGVCLIRALPFWGSTAISAPDFWKLPYSRPGMALAPLVDVMLHALGNSKGE